MFTCLLSAYGLYRYMNGGRNLERLNWIQEEGGGRAKDPFVYDHLFCESCELVSTVTSKLKVEDKNECYACFLMSLKVFLFFDLLEQPFS